MSAPDAAGAAARPQSRFGRLLASRLGLVIAIVLTAVLVALAAVTAVRFFAPPAPAVAVGEPMPSAFTLEVQVGGSPFISRGETGTILVSAQSGRAIERLELWADDRLYIAIDGDDLPDPDEFGTLRLSLDYVPLDAGGHLLFARATDSRGGVAQSGFTPLSVLDLAADVGIEAAAPTWLDPPDMSIETVPGDTLQAVSDRLMLPIADLTVDDPTITLGWDPFARLPIGTRISGPVATLPPDLAQQTLPIPEWKPGLALTVQDCTLTVTSSYPTAVRLYGGPGNVFIHEIPANGKSQIGNLALGTTVITGLPVGASDPLLPMSIVVPDECATYGWSGGATLNNGILITDEVIDKPFAYVSIDKRQWVRVPGREGSTLSDGQVNDLRAYIDQGAYDQVDVEVWSGDELTATKKAEGHFCRKNANKALGESSNSGGACDPPGPPANVVTPGPTSRLFELTPTLPAGSTSSFGVGNAPGYPEYALSVSGGGPLNLTTNAHALGYQGVRYQFSFVPLSPMSPSLTAPGVFHYIDVQTSYADSTTTITPGEWQNTSLTEALKGTDLALNDQLALDIAKARLANGLDLVSSFYIRAVATSFVDGKTASIGMSTASIKVVLPDYFEGSWPKVADPAVRLVPGVDETASWTAAADETSNWDQSIQTYGSTSVSGLCVEVLRYPPAGQQTYAPGGLHDDLYYAKARFPSKDRVYCEDEAAAGKRWTAAYEQRKKDAKCTLGCVLTFMVYGALQGFLLGGPIGALVGGIAGLYLGALSYASPGFYADLKKAWDAIANVYNKVFDAVFTMIDKINLACMGLSYLSSKAGDFCNGTVRTAAGAVIQYYTGLPPNLSTSAELEAAADGQFEAAFTLVLEAGLKSLGLSCATFTVSSAEAANMLIKSGDFFGSSKGKGGCELIAGIITKQMRAALDKRQADVMGAIVNMAPIQGLVISPISDSVPSVLIQAPESTITQWGKTCPVVANTTISEASWSYQLRPVLSEMRLHEGVPTAAGVAAEDPFWFGQIPVGVVPQTWWGKRPTGTNQPPDADFWERQKHQYVDQSKILQTKQKEQGAPYLRVTLDSPCFTKTYVLTAPKYATFLERASGVVPAFTLDTRKAVGFW